MEELYIMAQSVNSAPPLDLQGMVQCRSPAPRAGHSHFHGPVELGAGCVN